ncbi:membrane protein [soil metagenome]
MTNSSAFGRSGPVLPSIPKGDVLGTYDTYLEAQGIVDRLAKADFDVAKLSIVGNDLKTVERVTGKLTYGRAALAGAASGAWLGLFFGLVLTIFTPPTPQTFGFVGAAVLIGAGFGVIFGIVTYAINRRRRDFTSTHQVLASNYQIIIDPELTAKAQQTLQSHPAE